MAKNKVKPKKIAKMGLRKTLSYSFSSLFSNWKWLSACVFLDLLFFLILFFFIRPAFFSKTLDYLYTIQGVISKFSIQYSAPENIGLFSMLSQSGAMEYVVWLLILMAVWAASLWFLFAFFNSANWYILNKKIFKQKLQLVEYSRRFFKLSMLWVMLYGLYNLITYIFSFSLTVTRQADDVVSPPIFFKIIFIIGLYFALVSYAMLLKDKKTFKRSFIVGVKNARALLPIYILTVLTYFLINILLVLFGKIDALLMMIGGFIFLFPFATIARAVFQTAVNEINKR